MPVVSKWMDELTYVEVNSADFPIAKLAGEGGIIAPFAGVTLICLVDVPGAPLTSWCIRFTFPTSTLQCGTGGASSVVTVTSDADGKFQFEVAGVLTSFYLLGVRVLSTAVGANGAVYSLYADQSVLDPATDFPGTPPPPNKPAKPILDTTLTNNEDGWGSTLVTWTTPDNIADIDGFAIWRTARFPAGTAQIRGTVPANAAIHPNYSYRDYIGADEEQGTIVDYQIQAYSFTPHTLGAISDESDEVLFDPEGEDPIDEEPDIEIPDPDEVPVLIPETPVPPNPPNQLLAPGTLTGAGYGGFNLGGSSLDDAVFMMNVSGIYTLVEGKLHDTLYERMTGITSQNVKIPDPFVKTGLV